MANPNESNNNNSNTSRSIVVALPIATALIYYFSNPKPQNYYDYTFRVADGLLHGAIGFAVTPPSWLNEFVPFEGFYYSVFPLGAVLSMVPFALLRAAGAIADMPGAPIAALLAGGLCFYLLKIAERYNLTVRKKILMSLAILFGTWMWTNLTFDGAWQLALGFAMVGETGAIYFSIYDRRPLLAGIFFALAFGNRTEILLTTPILLYLVNREYPGKMGSDDAGNSGERNKSDAHIQGRGYKIGNLSLFCVVPFLLGIATLAYNYVRFHAIADFGYARIPGVLNEPWYDHGIFSLYYIPRQAWEMLWKMWQFRSTFPYFVPDGFSSSILWSSPFLLFVLRFGSRDRALKYVSWAAMVVLTFLLWMHGNSGGWQFSYRYAMVLLPWAFVILLESSPKKITRLEAVVYGFSFLMNGYATWLFHWTKYLNP